MINLERKDLGMLVLRLAIGIIFFLHGSMKLIGARSLFVQEVLHLVGWQIPEVLIWLVTLLELIGGLALILGIFARYAALLLTLEMLLIVALFHAGQGFFIVAVPNVPLAYGFEFHVALIGSLICLALGGPGLWALDSMLPGRPVRRAGKVG